MIASLVRLVARVVGRRDETAPAPSSLAKADAAPRGPAAGPSPRADSPQAPRSARYLLIVATEAGHRLPQIRGLFRPDPDVYVLLDRRHGERRRASLPPPIERRRGERRRRDYWQDPKFHPVVLAPVGSGRNAEPPPAPPTEAAMMEDTSEDRQRVLAWAQEGHEVLGRLVPILLREHEAQRRRLEDTEAERDRLATEARQLRRELGELQERHQVVLAAQSDIVGSVGAFMTNMTQILEPMRVLADKLQRLPRAGA